MWSAVAVASSVEFLSVCLVRIEPYVLDSYVTGNVVSKHNSQRPFLIPLSTGVEVSFILMIKVSAYPRSFSGEGYVYILWWVRDRKWAGMIFLNSYPKRKLTESWSKFSFRSCCLFSAFTFSHECFDRKWYKSDVLFFNSSKWTMWLVKTPPTGFLFNSCRSSSPHCWWRS